MCSSTLGPATIPSFVTCPIRMRANRAPWQGDQLIGRLAHLTDRPGRRVELGRADGLDRVDDDHGDAVFGDRADDFFEIGAVAT